MNNVRAESETQPLINAEISAENNFTIIKNETFAESENFAKENFVAPENEMQNNESTIDFAKINSLLDKNLDKLNLITEKMYRVLFDNINNFPTDKNSVIENTKLYLSEVVKKVLTNEKGLTDKINLYNSKANFDLSSIPLIIRLTVFIDGKKNIGLTEDVLNIICEILYDLDKTFNLNLTEESVTEIINVCYDYALNSGITFKN